MINYALKRKDGKIVPVTWRHVDVRKTVRKVIILREFEDGRSEVETQDFFYSFWHKKPGSGRRGDWVRDTTAIVPDEELFFVADDGLPPSEGDVLFELINPAPAETEAESSFMA